MDTPVYIVYDEIPSPDTNSEKKPICLSICTIIFISRKIIGFSLKRDNIFLFFNPAISDNEITKFIKILLGIPDNKTFTLNPTKFNRSFVLLTACGVTNSDYCVYSSSNSMKLGDISLKAMTEHKIVLTGEKFNYPNSSQIKDSLSDKPDTDSVSVFKQRVSAAVLPYLYKQYFKSKDDVPSDDELTEKAVKLYGEDKECFDKEYLEQWLTQNYPDQVKQPEMVPAPKNNPPECEIYKPDNKGTHKPYEVFKADMIRKIKEKIREVIQQYRLSQEVFTQLNQKRPMKIIYISNYEVEPTDYSNMFIKWIYKQNNMTISESEFTNGVVDTYVNKELAEYKKKYVEEVKRERVTQTWMWALEHSD